MAELILAFKQITKIVYTVFLNCYLFLNFFYKAGKKHFNKDFSNAIEKKGYTIKLNEDFEGNEINWMLWDKWSAEGNASFRSKTSSVASTDCIKVENSKCTLFVRKNDGGNYSEFPFKSGQINTSYSYNWVDGKKVEKGFWKNYGYLEICCKVPAKGKLFWPSFWLWGDIWPPEIDIFEFMDEKDVHDIHTKGISMSTHWGYENKKNESKIFGSMIVKSLRKFFGTTVNFDEHFHTYAIEWSPDYIDFYIDNVKVYRNIYYVPDNKMSIQVGVGTQDQFVPTEEDLLNSDYVIDYIRWYEKD